MVQLETAQTKIPDALVSDNGSLASGNSKANSDVSLKSEGTNKRLKLPKLEIPKFSGEALDWLAWWAQF